MTRNDVLNSEVLLKRFCKDYGLPIKVFQQPYFEERLETFDCIYDCMDAFDYFCSVLKDYKDAQEYLATTVDSISKIIAYIKSHSDYRKFCADNSYQDFKPLVDKKDIYLEENNGKIFISIDMRQANFSALKHYSRDIFNCDFWDDFVGLFTSNYCIQESKYLRQVIFGNLNPKRIMKYELYLTNQLLQHLTNQLGNLNIYSMNNDEIIIMVDDNFKYNFATIIQTVMSCPNDIGKLYDVKKIRITKIPNTDGWIESDYHFEDFKIKCLDANLHHQVVKYFLGQPITDNDLVFNYQGVLARYLKEMGNPWHNE